MKIGNITLIVGETYYTKFGETIEKLKLEKIHFERICENDIQVSVSRFPKNRNEKNTNSWFLWSSEIYHTRDEAIKN